MDRGLQVMWVASVWVCWCALALGRGDGWWFLPTYGQDVRGVGSVRVPETGAPELPGAAKRLLLQASGRLTAAERREVRWHPVRFPHREFMRLMPRRRVHGWYAHAFAVPPALRGLDVLLELGLIDDADETFLNGAWIGGLGRIPDGSSWQTDRRYRVSAERLLARCNRLSVHVWSLWGLGGMVGPPVLKAALAQQPSRWQVARARLAAGAIPKLNGAVQAEEAMRQCFSGGSPEWQSASEAWPLPEGLTVLRLTFDLPAGDALRRGKRQLLDLGLGFDVVAVYLNGRRVGLSGRFPASGMEAFTEAGERVRCVVEPERWSATGRNELLVVVYCERGRGGLTGEPGLVLEQPGLGGEEPLWDTCAAWLPTLVQSGRMGEARRLLSRCRVKTEREQAWRLSWSVCLSYLEWRDGGGDATGMLTEALGAMADCLSSCPTEAPRQSAMQAFCQILDWAGRHPVVMSLVRRRFPAFCPHGIRQPPDRLTHGNWSRSYGTLAWVFGAMGQRWDVHRFTRRPFDYRLSIPGDRDYPCMWLPRWQYDLTDELAMSVPDGNHFLRSMRSLAPGLVPGPAGRHDLAADRGRIASWWDDHGEMHPFDDEGPDLLLELQPFADPPRRSPDWQWVTLHHQDYDWRKTVHPRQQSVLVFDEAGQLLDTVWLGKTDGGVYQSFLLDMSRPVRFRSVKHRGACVALSGFFADRLPTFRDQEWGYPNGQLHALSVLSEASDDLSALGRRYLSMPATPERVRMARAILNRLGDGAAARGAAPVAWGLLFALAVDDAGEFERNHESYTRCLQAMSAAELHRLLFYLSYMNVHPRWSCLAAMVLLARLERGKEEDMARYLCGFVRHSADYRLDGVRRSALRLWRQLGLPEDDDYRELARSLPEWRANGKSEQGQN